AFDLLVQPLQRIGRVKLSPMGVGEVEMGEYILGGLLKERCSLAKPWPQPVAHLAQLGDRARMVGLSEDRAHDRGDRLARTMRHRRKKIPHEVHAAALPACSREHGRQRLLEPLVRIRDHQTYAAKTALHQAPQKRSPKRCVLRWPSI